MPQTGPSIPLQRNFCLLHLLCRYIARVAVLERALLFAGLQTAITRSIQTPSITKTNAQAQSHCQSNEGYRKSLNTPKPQLISEDWAHRSAFSGVITAVAPTNAELSNIQPPANTFSSPPFFLNPSPLPLPFLNNFSKGLLRSPSRATHSSTAHSFALASTSVSTAVPTSSTSVFVPSLSQSDKKSFPRSLVLNWIIRQMWTKLTAASIISSLLKALCSLKCYVYTLFSMLKSTYSLVLYKTFHNLHDTISVFTPVNRDLASQSFESVHVQR